MAIIEINHLSHNYGDKQILLDTSFVLNPGEKIGLTGVNGAGKSSLIKIMMGQVIPDDAEMYFNKKYTIGYLDQHAEINGHQTIKQYLGGAFAKLYEVEEKLNQVNNSLATETNPVKLEKLLNQSGDLFEYLQANNFYQIDSDIEKVAAGLGVTALGLETPVNTLSGGQRAKVLLAKLLLEQPDVMILDEPTNFLDVEHIEWLKKFINSSEKSFVIVSHDASFLNAVVNIICDIDNQKIVRYVGNLDKAMLIKEERRRLYEKSYESQQKEIKKLEDYIAKNKARASTARMASSREKRLEKMDILEKPSEQIKPTFRFAYKPFGGRMMLKVDQLVVGYQKPLLKPITFEVNHGEVVAITGFNGIGKSTLLKTICGIIPQLAGEVEIARNVKIGYYEQENDFHGFSGTPLMYMRQEFPKLLDKQLRANLNRSGLTTIHCQKQIEQLSGGEQSKIKICVLTIKESNLLLLDEPTNHLDKYAIDCLKEAIKEYEGAVILVSHNKEFVQEVADKIIQLDKMHL